MSPQFSVESVDASGNVTLSSSSIITIDQLTQNVQNDTTVISNAQAIVDNFTKSLASATAALDAANAQLASDQALLDVATKMMASQTPQ